MNTDTKTTTFDSSLETFLDSEMANLFKMTNDVVMKIKLKTMGVY